MAGRSARRLESLAVADRPGPHGGRVQVMDLSDVSWLDPVHLVGIAATAHRAAGQGSRLRLTGLGADQAGYAARMHLGQVIEQFGGEHELPVVRERDLHDRLLEVCPLRTRDDLRGLTELVFNRVAGQDGEMARALYVALAEVGSNVCDHSQSIGFMAAQTIPEQQLLRFAVADSGVGILSTLAGRGAGDDRTAIEMALAGTSRNRAPGHGTGLPTTVEKVVRSLGGEMLLASGRAATTANARGWTHRSLGFRLPGTIFEGSVPTAVTPPSARRAIRTPPRSETMNTGVDADELRC
ncbi:MAG: hypothetical protein ACR2N4_17395 [Jatrophihabitans sp.]